MHPSFFLIPLFTLLLSAIQLARANEDAFVEGEVLVTFKTDVAASAAETSLAKRSLRFEEKYDRLGIRHRRVSGMVREHSRTTAALIADLKTDPEVETVEPNYLRRIYAVTPNDTDFPKLWALENTGQTVNSIAGTSGTDTRFLPAWNLSRTSSTEAVIGIIDTGVDITHPDLEANIWTNPGEIAGNGVDDDGNGYTDDVHGYDFVGSTASPTATAEITDSSDHGTHIAGTIAAVGKNQSGVIGLQYHAKVLPLKVSRDGESMTSSAVIAACNYAVKLKEKGVNIVAINASYGGGSRSTSEENAIAALRDAGIVFCAAAGNSTANNDTTADYPANYNLSNIISVAALTQTNTLAAFSNYGATTVDLAAPGVNIFSTMPQDLVAMEVSLTVGTTSYSTQTLEFSGTTPAGGLTRSIYSCGTGQTAADFPAAVSGNIALIQRGTNTFADKVTRAKTAGAVAVIVYDNTSDPLSGTGWTLGETGDWLPAFQVTQATGNAIIASLPATGTLVSYSDPQLAYQFLSGTSMATPQVAAAVAFAAWNFPSETMEQRISRILDNTTAVAALAGKTVTGGRLDLLKMVDTDGNDLPDWWETENLGSLDNVSTADPDGDGFSNLTEFLSGTDPTSAASHLAFSTFQPISDSGGTSFQLTFPSVAERSYQIEWSENLDVWNLLGDTLLGTGAPLEVSDVNILETSPRRFYRLKILDE